MRPVTWIKPWRAIVPGNSGRSSRTPREAMVASQAADGMRIVGRTQGASAARVARRSLAICADVRLMGCLIALIAALLLAPRHATAAAHSFTSTEGGYSVSFPAAPQEQVSEDANARTVLNALNHDNAYYAVVHVDNKVDLKLNDELEGNIRKFTEQFHAPTQLRRKKKIPRAPGDELPAEEFTFESDALIGKGVVIVEGRRTFMVAAFAIKPHDRKATVDRFVKSFKLKASAPSNGKPAKVTKEQPKPEDAALAPQGRKK
jgi:hypothetical protein